MKTWHWILLIGAIGIGGWLLFKNWTKIPIIKKVGSAKVPDTFKRHDGQGNVTWEKKNGEYFYTLHYGMVAETPQKTTLENFMKAYKS